MVACLALAASCSREKTAKEHRWSFAEEGVVFDAEFLRAWLSECKQIGLGESGVVIRPENMRVNKARV